MTTKDDYQYSPVAGNEETDAKFSVEQNNVDIRPNKMSAKSAVPTNRKFLYIAACIGNLVAFVCGTSFGWTSPEIPQLQLTPEEGNPLPEAINEDQKSWIGSLLPVGATIGPFLAGILADKIGRKNSLLVGGVPFVVAFGIATQAQTVFLFYLMRFLCGIGVGIIFTVLPMYIGEIAEDEVRDSLGSFMQLFIVVGLTFSYALGPYMSITAFNIICLIAPCAFLVSFYIFIPESPYYLIRTDKAQAEQALMKLRAKPQESVQEELLEIKKNVEEALANKASFFDIFKSKGLTKALIISVGLITFQQFSGVNIILFYTQNLFEEAGSTIPPEICGIIIGVVQVIGSGLTPILVEKKGKKFLLIVSAAGMAVSLGVLSFFLIAKAMKMDVGAIAWLPILSVIAYMITYCLGFGPLPWAVMGELFPSNIKSAASTVTAAACWFLGFIITKYMPAIWTWLSFSIFSVCCVGAGIFVFYYMPDTSGKSLQEIQDILSGKRRPVNPAC